MGRLAGRAALALIAVWVVVVVALHLVQGEAFDPVRRPISELALGDGGVALDVVQVLLGLASLGLAAVLRPRRVAVLVAIWGAGLVVLGLFHIDAADVRSATTTGAVHAAAAFVAFVALVAAALQHAPVAHGRLAAAMALLLTVVLVLPEAVYGIGQRLFVASCLLWLALVARRLLRAG